MVSLDRLGHRVALPASTRSPIDVVGRSRHTLTMVAPILDPRFGVAVSFLPDL